MTDGASSSISPQEPRPILRLQESLINRIAAGEIIHRPASALKELLENSLDAGATAVRVTVKDGGLKLLQIQDNGCGIRKKDLPILAERFTTSKLSSFEDLSRLTTYGFRGEALASISHVSHLSVVTKTKTDTCAWKASFHDGSLVRTSTGQPIDPKPCAGNDGTTISIEDLFYNTPARLSATRNTSEEYARILDVITKYAVHNPKVAFVCKKSGTASPDLTTPSASETPHAIRQLYGSSIAKELLHLKLSSAKPAENQKEGDEDDEMDYPEAWSAEGYFTSTNYQGKKTVFLLFINHRLVEAPRMKRSFETVYGGVLSKGASPFLYLSLQIDPRSVDVNVHPTKREVHFLNEDAIIERISDALQNALATQNQSRAFEYQTLLTGGIALTEALNSRKRSMKESEAADDDDTPGTTSSRAVEPKKKVYSQHKVRTSLNDRTLDSMFPISNPSQMVENDSQDHNSANASGSKVNKRTHDIQESQCYLTSVRNLRQAVLNERHNLMTEIIQKHIFVGIVDLQRCLSLVQHSTNLYLINHNALSEHLFYQLGLRQFGDFQRMKLEPAPPLKTLIQIAVDAEDTTACKSLTKAEIVERIFNLLMERREMLTDYFSFEISEAGFIQSLPLLLREYIPNLNNLPSFLMRIGPEVDWTSEGECFETFLRELAYFYASGPALPSPSDSNAVEMEAEKAERWQIEHILFPALRRHLIAPKQLLDNDVVQIANLPDLYKVFERC